MTAVELEGPYLWFVIVYYYSPIANQFVVRVCHRRWPHYNTVFIANGVLNNVLVKGIFVSNQDIAWLVCNRSFTGCGNGTDSAHNSYGKEKSNS